MKNDKINKLTQNINVKDRNSGKSTIAVKTPALDKFSLFYEEVDSTHYYHDHDNDDLGKTVVTRRTLRRKTA